MRNAKVKDFFVNQILELEENRFKMFQKDFQKAIIFWEQTKTGIEKNNREEDQKKEEKFANLILGAYLKGRSMVSGYTATQKMILISELKETVDAKII